MKKSKFLSLVETITKLSISDYLRLKESLKKIDEQQLVQLTLETPKKELVCPRCSCNNLWRWGHRNNLQRYKCKGCHKTFNSLTQTPLSRLRKKSKWMEYALCLTQGVSVRKAARRCQVSSNTAFLWRHHFLINSKKIKASLLSGIVEADETYFLRSEKGSRNMSRAPRKRGGKASKRGLSSQQVCVFVSRDRSRNTFDLIFNKFNAQSLKKSFAPVLSKDALFCSDGSGVYKKFVRENQIRHGALNISSNIRVRKKIVHIQNVNSYHSRLKKWMIRFNGVSTKYLDSYLGWFRALDEFNMNIVASTMLMRSKIITPYRNTPLT